MKNGWRVVLADDHEMFRAGLKSLIEKEHGIRVVAEAQDGQELLQRLGEVPCDLVVLDLSMPNMDGMAALKQVRRQFSHVKVVVLTMRKDPEHFKRAMSLGSQGYVLKEDAYDELILAIKLICKGKQFVSPPIANILTEQIIRSVDDEETSSLEILTKREQQVLKMVASGLANKNIATKLKISIRTVETHRSNLSHKLGIKHTAGLVKFALSKGLI